MKGISLSRLLTYGLFLLIAGGYALDRFGVARKTLALGEPVPAFTAQLSDGSKLDLGHPPGRTLVLTFWASWCRPCRQEAPLLNAVQSRAQVVGISVDSADVVAAAKLAQGIGIEFPIIGQRPDLPALFGVQSIPTTYVIAADGTVVFGQTGVLTADELTRGLDAADELQI